MAALLRPSRSMHGHGDPVASVRASWACQCTLPAEHLVSASALQRTSAKRMQFAPRKAAAKKSAAAASAADAQAAQAAPQPASGAAPEAGPSTSSAAAPAGRASAASAGNDPFAQLIEQAKAAQIDPSKGPKRRKQEQLSVAFGGANVQGTAARPTEVGALRCLQPRIHSRAQACVCGRSQVAQVHGACEQDCT